MKFCTQRAVKNWHRLPRVAVGAPSLEVFKARLDGALDSLSWWVAALPMAGGWTAWSLSSLQPKPLCDSMMITLLNCL